MLEVERQYGQYNNRTGLAEWFFSAGEGVYDPFTSQEKVWQALDEFKKFSFKTGRLDYPASRFFQKSRCYQTIPYSA